MSMTPHARQYDRQPADSFDDSAGAEISELKSLVDELRAELVSLRLQVKRLQQSAGRGLIHPSDIVEGWQ
jgi:hypothetical protein